ncbi:O-antigen ligase family protein [Photobacterium leiognathi]|uniref:O-antigen ligase family protein n=1 Tax=Photobacterium leiognathi TaxID=553611 RepID=UPI000D161EBF|nr:O-antigen ligase family protein [Photobacterium leiognathi]PSW57454.1 hypothetical protein C0W50_07695 [Photobacterium leiognathi subsp. mandapamensis]
MNKLHSLVFTIFVFLVCISVTFFSGTSLESQLNITGGKRFFISSTMVIFLGFISSVVFIAVGFTSRVNLIKINGIFIFFMIIILVKTALVFRDQDNLLFSFNAAIFLIITIFSFFNYYIILGKKNYLKIIFYTYIVILIFSIAVGSFMMVFGELNLVFSKLVQFGNYPRMYSWYGNPNIMATSVAIGVILLINNKVNNSRVYISIVFAALILTGSKGVTVSLIFTLISILLMRLFFINNEKVITFKRMIIFLLLSLVAILLLTQFNDFIYKTLFRLDASDIGTASGRVEIWLSALDRMTMASDYQALFGYGYGRFSEDFSKSAHSYYIKTAYEDGLMFLFLFMSFLIVSMISAIKCYRKKRDNTYIIYMSLVLFISYRGITSPTFFQDKLEAFIFIMFVIPMFFKDLGEES